MSKPLRIALAQFDFPVGAIDANARRIAQMIGAARDEHGADVVVFPELALSGYPPEDLLNRPAFLARCAQAMRDVAQAARGIVAVVGWPEAAGAVVYNAASVLRDGGMETTYRKRELPNYAVFDERRHFVVDPDGGPCVFEVNGVRVGLVICEDLWFAEPIAETVAQGAQVVLAPNASPFERDKSAQRDALLTRRVAETVVGIAYLICAMATARGIRLRGRSRNTCWWWITTRPRASFHAWSGRAKPTNPAKAWPGARWCAARGITLARTGFRARCSGFPAAWIQRWCWPSRWMRWALKT